MIFLYDFIFHNFIVSRICINAIDFRNIIYTSDNFAIGFFYFKNFRNRSIFFFLVSYEQMFSLHATAASERLGCSIIFRASTTLESSLKRVKCARTESVKYTVKITPDQAYIPLPLSR